ncbi:hypothetical protein K493DRAFT_48989 [Basidiobolus meristosporus CBS 931.73]|uniref:Hook C-terminal domain-containing protein n=1 Tax=Basidiobolus meristosporus CBS 931.73 TaxID=1314790 RepID=A0A1Y1Z3R9_9FUNG|nr:hypothetical protein K493DRAFT_48989 [Basidiobolus meristosporus CBS 931.73]|eukprot:ORY04846.1 hypothetical protein K493DRAFT_48989 [Basidiobolus meristosporus CBS 931.73]
MRLEREVQAMHQTRNDPGNAQQIILLENLLEDSNRMKGKFEQDYLKAHQQNLVLENEVEMLRAAASGEDPDRAASDFALTLRMRLNDSEKELSEAKEKLAAAEAKLASVEKELVICKSDLNLVGKDKLDALAAIREEAGAEINKLQKEYDSLVSRNRELDAENKKQMLQINELLIEKDSVQTQNIQSKDILLEKERINSELKATLAALESKNKTGDAEPLKNQLLTESQKNLKLLEEIDKKNNDINMFLAKLKKAKEYIRHQDYKMKMLKEKAETVPKMNYEEALTSLQAELTNRDKEVGRLKALVNETRVQAKREQQLIISAWYDLARRVQRDVAAPQRNGPTSWLGQQRRTLDIPLKRR